MKKLIMAAVAMGCMTLAEAQDLKEIQLPEPDKTRGTAVMKALSDRVSVRECSPEELSLRDLSDVIWAANGINRPEEGRRTAPSALNKQDIDVYVFTDEGVFLYLPQRHALQPVAEDDHREVLAGPPSPARTQDFVKAFPVILLFVSDLSRFEMTGERVKLMAAMDAGIVSENVNLFCSSVGLCTVPRASMDEPAVRRLLNLADHQIPLLNNPVGYPKQ